MAENVNGADIFGSGSHRWDWGQRAIARKEIRTVGTTGAASWPIQVGARPGRITGADGPAVLKVSGHDTRALADAAMDTLEAAIEDLITAGTECTWEDDTGRTGSHLQVLRYQPAARRLYTRDSDAKHGIWQEYDLGSNEAWLKT